MANMNLDISAVFQSLTRTEHTRLYRKHIEHERARRITAHKEAVAAQRRALASDPYAPRPLNLFADGDSWFDYPLPILAPNDTISSIGKQGTPQPLILNLGTTATKPATFSASRSANGSSTT